MTAQEALEKFGWIIVGSKNDFVSGESFVVSKGCRFIPDGCRVSVIGIPTEKEERDFSIAVKRRKLQGLKVYKVVAE